MMLISSLVLLQQYFNRRRALAVSIASLGFSVGGLTFGPLTAALLDAYAIRGTLLIIGGLFFQMSVFCFLFRPAPGVTAGKGKSVNSARESKEMVQIVSSVKSDGSSKVQHDDEPTIKASFLDTENDQHPRSRAARLVNWLGRLFADLFDFSLLKAIHFQLFVFASFCLFFGFSSFFQHTPSRAAHFGVEPWLISVLPTLIASATAVSRIVMGFVANMSCTCLVLQFAISVTLSGLVQIMTWLATTFETIALYCILLGTING